VSVVRSDWEASIERYIRSKYPALRIETNNRRIIPSRNTRSSYFELDIFVPELCLGIEVNGETYHDRRKYEDDSAHGTVRSDEMYKENYCRSVGIQLLHVWSSESAESIQRRIDDAIQQRLADPGVEEWCPPGRNALLAFIGDLLARYGVPAFLVLFFFIIPACAAINSRIEANKQAELRQIEWRQNEAAAKLQHEENERVREQEQQLWEYEKHYGMWLIDEDYVVQLYNLAVDRGALRNKANRSFLRREVNKWIEEIQAYPLGDVPESCESQHRQMLSRAFKLKARLK